MLTKDREQSVSTLMPAKTESKYWEAPAGGGHATVTARVERPAFVYRGYADPHWKGQFCHLEAVTDTHVRVVVMSCGCRTSVPWWTLDPA
jgi:hypothetical protein